MNLFTMGARIRVGKKLKPTIGRLGVCSGRILETMDMSISVPSTGVANTHRRASRPMECSWNSTKE